MINTFSAAFFIAEIYPRGLIVDLHKAVQTFRWPRCVGNLLINLVGVTGFEPTTPASRSLFKAIFPLQMIDSSSVHAPS